MTVPATAGQLRFWLASQDDFEAKQGVYVRLDSDWSADEQGQLQDLRIAGGVGNGKHWAVSVLKPVWQLQHVYTATLRYDGKTVQMQLDDQQAKQVKAQFMPRMDATELRAGASPGWAQKGNAGNFQIIQHSITLKQPGKPDITEQLMSVDVTQTHLWLFESTVTRKINWQPQPQQPFEIQATFSIVDKPSIDQLPPLVDRYGQVIDGKWPNKITSDEQLKQSYTDEIKQLEQMKIPDNLDDFGGNKQTGFSQKPTGFWTTVRRDGMYWLITPQGNPCYYLGVCGAPALNFPATCIDGRENIFAQLPPRTGLYAKAWTLHPGKGDHKDKNFHLLSWQASNLIRKFGSSWMNDSIELANLRLRKWGFTGVGKWGGFVGGGTGDQNMNMLTCVPVISWGSVPKLAGKHPDIFDSAIQKLAEQSIYEQIKPHINNPYVLGWSFTNERGGIIMSDEILQIMAMPHSVAAKRVLCEYALTQLYDNHLATLSKAWNITVDSLAALQNNTRITMPKEDVQKLRLYMADRYHAFIYATFKKLDPNHMFLSHWLVPGWWEDENDWLIPAKYCDIMGYDRYNDVFTPDWLLKLMQESDKPVMCGEYSFPPFNGGRSGHSQFKVSAVDDADAGRKYAANLKTAASNPWCVGQLWFVYRDQPITGRDAAITNKVVQGEAYSFGLVDVADQPKWEMIKPMREANLNAVQDRLNASARQ
jgi:hypothetical protein